MTDYMRNYHSESNEEIIGAGYQDIKEIYYNKPIVALWLDLEQICIEENEILEYGFEDSEDSKEFFMCSEDALTIMNMIKKRDYKEKLFLIHTLEMWGREAESEKDFEKADEYQNQVDFFEKFFYKINER